MTEVSIKHPDGTTITAEIVAANGRSAAITRLVIVGEFTDLPSLDLPGLLNFAVAGEKVSKTRKAAPAPNATATRRVTKRVPAAKKATKRATPLTGEAPKRPYVRQPDAADVLEAFTQAGTFPTLAEHYSNVLGTTISVDKARTWVTNAKKARPDLVPATV